MNWTSPGWRHDGEGKTAEQAPIRHAIEDACILISLLLQYGVEPEAIAKSLATTPVHGTAHPATVIGVIATAVKEGALAA